MAKKIMFTLLVLLALAQTPVTAKEEKQYFKIYGDSQDKVLAYQAKNELIASFQLLVQGLDPSAYSQAIEDNLPSQGQMDYLDHTVIVWVGDGRGEVLEGEMKTNYCRQNDEEIETHFFFWELFKGN